MNVFVLDADPAAAARAHHDRHVGKMLLEGTQMMCTVARARGLLARMPSMYRATHAGHPCTRWLASSPSALPWLRALCDGLAAEHVHRFGTVHKSHAMAVAVASLLSGSTCPTSVTPPLDAALAMPDEYKSVGDPVGSYRAYYRATKVHGARWTNRQPPAWLAGGAP